jgi:hypothetical protein
MKHDGVSTERVSPEAMTSPELPPALARSARDTAEDLDALLGEAPGRDVALDAKVGAYRNVVLTHLLDSTVRRPLDPSLLRWPDFLYIPSEANPFHYWFSGAPDDHRYALDWTSPSGSVNRASRKDGTLFVYSALNQATNQAEPGVAGVGILYTPTMTYGVIDLQPHVECVGVLRWYLENNPRPVAGHVDVAADLWLGAWQVIPGGYDRLSLQRFEVEAIRRDETHGSELHDFDASFNGPPLSASFVVQSGRTYLLGVVAQLRVTSTLTVDGKQTGLDASQLRAWGSMNCIVPQMNVSTKQVYIP